MKKFIHTLIGIFIISVVGFSQGPTEYSAEYQHGFGNNFNENMIGARYEGYSSLKGKSSWSLGINYNFSILRSEKEAAGVSGFGIYAGYRYGLSYGISGNLYAGIRTSFTFNKDVNGNKYSLFTPSIETGYHYTSQDFGKGGCFTPNISLGYDLKLANNEKAKFIHEGAVFTPGISIGYRF